MTHLRHLHSALAMAILLVATSAMGALAQEPVAPLADEEVTGDDYCRAPPESEPERDAAAAQVDLSEWLARCGSVLAPPAVGDPDIVEQPPDTGTTPVIPPGEVPEQPPG